MSKDQKKKEVKKIKEKKVKKSESFFTGVAKETKKIRWPNKKEMITYTVATIACVVIFVIFFTGVDLILAGIKQLVH